MRPDEMTAIGKDLSQNFFARSARWWRWQVQGGLPRMPHASRSLGGHPKPAIKRHLKTGI
jgi:hypothetical protein